MSDPLIREIDNYVIMEPGQKEKFLTSKETLEWLEKWIQEIHELPKDLKTKPSAKDAAQYLLDTACDLEIHPGFTIQWFAVRIDPPRF
tara:strand:- start:185 stop:448 length:264 start_codon:yes stop_codon:yes gene_type:complete